MSTPVSEQKLLWHLTAIDNLESILKNGLLARNRLQTFTDVADQEIVQKRDLIGLGDYVPFHFFQGNPFDGSTLKGNENIEFCFITIRRDLARENGYKILSGHPLSPSSILYHDYDTGMENINWKLVDSRDYSDQACKIACMAECLAFGCVKPIDFFAITVKTEKMKLFVEQLSRSLLGKYNFHVDANKYYFSTGDK